MNGDGCASRSVLCVIDFFCSSPIQVLGIRHRDRQRQQGLPQEQCKITRSLYGCAILSAILCGQAQSSAKTRSPRCSKSCAYACDSSSVAQNTKRSACMAPSRNPRNTTNCSTTSCWQVRDQSASRSQTNRGSTMKYDERGPPHDRGLAACQGAYIAQLIVFKTSRQSDAWVLPCWRQGADPCIWVVASLLCRRSPPL